MTSVDSDRDADRDVCADLKQLSAREALRLEPRPIVVPEGAEVLLSPSNAEYASGFARISLGSYDDLRLLGLVPRRLAEEKVRQAIEADDSEAYALAGTMLGRAPQPCSCHGRDPDPAAARGNPMRSTYNAIRRRHNPALARVLSDHYGTRMAWDGPVPSIVRKWAVAVARKPDVLVSLYENITIHQNATLSVVPAAKSLMAWNVWIHVTGRLVSQGSYLKLWANSVTRFSGYLSAAQVDTAMKVAPIWSLND